MKITVCFLLLAFFTIHCSVEENRARGKTKQTVYHELCIGIVGKQFEWMFQYPGPDNKPGKRSYKFITGKNPLGIDTTDANAADDFVVFDTLVLPVDSVKFTIDSRDVIHSMFLPQFRIQMNAVPGLTTVVKFIPKLTTAEVRKEMKDPDFNYIIMCNKICGEGHYQMKKPVIVKPREQFDAWYKERSGKK